MNRLMVAVLLALVPAWPVVAEEVELAPHRAEYVLEQARASESGNIVAVDGSLVYAVHETCDAWRVEHNLELVIHGSGGETVDTRSETVAEESKDGLAFRFESRTYAAGEQTDELKGEARLTEPGGEGRVVFHEGEPDSVPLPAGTLFPMAHTKASIRAALSGDRLFWAQVYDGSERDTVYGVNVVIGDREEGSEGGGQPLLQGARWHMAVAYFERDPEGRSEQSPVFEYAGQLHANGVSGDMTLDYGEFFLRGRLTRLEPIDPPNC